jgi:hypothetical protein
MNEIQIEAENSITETPLKLVVIDPGTVDSQSSKSVDVYCNNMLNRLRLNREDEGEISL